MPNIHYNEILIQIVTTDIWRNYYTIDKDKKCKTDGIKTIFHNRINRGCIVKSKNKNTTLQYTYKTEHNNISDTAKSIIASSKDNESMCKQVLWLAPAPPACTPNHHNHNSINHNKQKSSSHDGYRLL